MDNKTQSVQKLIGVVFVRNDLHLHVQGTKHERSYTDNKAYSVVSVTKSSQILTT